MLALSCTVGRRHSSDFCECLALGAQGGNQQNRSVASTGIKTCLEQARRQGHIGGIADCEGLLLPELIANSISP